MKKKNQKSVKKQKKKNQALSPKGRTPPFRRLIFFEKEEKEFQSDGSVKVDKSF